MPLKKPATRASPAAPNPLPAEDAEPTGGVLTVPASAVLGAVASRRIDAEAMVEPPPDVGERRVRAGAVVVGE